MVPRRQSKQTNGKKKKNEHPYVHAQTLGDALENSAERQATQCRGKMSGWSELVSAAAQGLKRDRQFLRNCSNFLFKGIYEGDLGC